jgi:error-prone DNA polymerase
MKSLVQQITYEGKLGEVGKLSDCGMLCSGENLVCEKNLGFGKDKNEDDKPGNFHKLRLGFRQIKGIREEEMILLIRGRETAYSNIADIRKSGVSQSTLEKLADADAFRSLGFDRRQALWEVSAIVDNPEGLFEGQIDALASAIEGQISLPLMSKEEHVVQDYASTALSLKAHPLSFVREKLRILHILSSHELNEVKDGSLVKVAGLVLVRQRPGTAGGVCFITIEDETGFSNLVVFQNLFEKYRKQILGSKLLMVEGKIQREGTVTHIIVKHCFDLTKLLNGGISYQKEGLPVHRLSRGDEKSPFPVTNKRPQIRQNAQQEVFPKARNFK